MGLSIQLHLEPPAELALWVWNLEELVWSAAAGEGE